MDIAAANAVGITDPLRMYVDTNIIHYFGAGFPRSPGKINAINALNALNNMVASGNIISVTSEVALVEEYDIYKGRAFFQREINHANINWGNRSISIWKRNEAAPLTSAMRLGAVKRAKLSINQSSVRKENPTEWPSALVEVICRSTDLHWSDALHLAMALALRCDYFLTDDEEFHDEMHRNLMFGSCALHQRLANSMSANMGLTRNRLKAPLIVPIYLNDPATAPLLLAI